MQNEFLLEIEDLLDRIYLDLDALRDTELDGRRRRELIDRMFRHVHSVKGSAASCGLQSISVIAHEFESLLDAARAGRIVLNDLILNTCNSATDVLSQNLGLSAAGIAGPSNTQVLKELQTLSRQTTSQATEETRGVLERVPSEISHELSEAERYRLESAINEGCGLFILSTSFDTSNFDREFFSLKERLAVLGEVISTSPTVDELHPDKINFRILYASSSNAAKLTNAFAGFPGVALKEVEITPDQARPALSKNSKYSTNSGMANFIRTDLDQLDRLISSTHQLFRKTSTALDMANTPFDISNLEKLHNEIKASFLNVENDLINLRMVSLGPTLERAARAGKTAARRIGKEIDFLVMGADLRIDKLLADAITDPLIHLCRNAVDHGIEATEKRKESGKPSRGVIRIEAMSEGGRLSVRVTDDGRGIDPEIISAAAKRLGLYETSEELDFERSLRLIFRPGFTTAESVSDLSGRGVGLDVVETAVEQAGGELRVSSKPGFGATFEIRLPVTFGIMDAMVVVSAGNHYCISVSQTVANEEADGGDNIDRKLQKFPLQEILGPSDAATQTVSSQSASSKHPNDTSPLAKLITCEFSIDRNNPASNHPKRIGILVDQIEGTEKVLVRSLGRHAGRWYGVAGATELRDGNVALVLDLPRLLSGLE